MNKKLLLAIVLVFVGVYLGMSKIDVNIKESTSHSNTSRPSQKNEKGRKVIEKKSIALGNESNKTKNRNSIKFEKDFYKKNQYLKEISKDPEFVEVYKKAIDKFKSQQFAEDMAVWLAIGLIFDSSPEYGELFERSISQLNEQKDEVYTAITNSMDSLKAEDSFLRQQLINVVGVMSLDKEKKISFFGNESSRVVILDENGEFSPDSLNITNSIAFLKQSGTTNEEARKFLEKSLKANPDPAIQEELRVRYDSYFPGVTNL